MHPGIKEWGVREILKIRNIFFCFFRWCQMVLTQCDSLAVFWKSKWWEFDKRGQTARRNYESHKCSHVCSECQRGWKFKTSAGKRQEWLCWCAVLCCGVLWCAVVWCVVVCCAVVWCGVLCCAVLWKLWRVVVWCAVLWCGVLWCAVLCCGVVCCNKVVCDLEKMSSLWSLTALSGKANDWRNRQQHNGRWKRREKERENGGKREERERERRKERGEREALRVCIQHVRSKCCVPATCPHEKNMWACCRYTRGHFERTHGDVLNAHTQVFSVPHHNKHHTTRNHTHHTQPPTHTQHTNTHTTHQHTHTQHAHTNTHTPNTHTPTHTHTPNTHTPTQTTPREREEDRRQKTEENRRQKRTEEKKRRRQKTEDRREQKTEEDRRQKTGDRWRREKRWIKRWREMKLNCLINCPSNSAPELSFSKKKK